MYYVLQVASGTEEKVEEQIRTMVDKKMYGGCFHPMRYMRKKFRGEWTEVYEKLLPGYVFITSDRIKKLYLELKRVPMVTKLLGKDGECFTTLSDQETDWLEQVMELTDGRMEVPVSQISVSENNVVTILSGPLRNVEGQIKKINLHRRIAEIEVDFMKRKTVVHLGIEMVEKN